MKMVVTDFGKTIMDGDPFLGLSGGYQYDMIVNHVLRDIFYTTDLF